MISKNVSLELQEKIAEHKTIMLNDVRKGKRISLEWNENNYVLTESNLSGLGKSKVSRASQSDLIKCIKNQEITECENNISEDEKIKKTKEKRCEFIKNRNDEIIETFLRHRNIKSLAATYKLMEKTILDILYRNNVNENRGMHKTKEERKGFEKNKKRDESIKDLYEGGISVPILARKHLLTTSVIYQIIKKQKQKEETTNVNQ